MVKTVGGHVWAKAIDKPYVVRGTVRRVRREFVGQFETLREAQRAARAFGPTALIYNAISGLLLEIYP